MPELTRIEVQLAALSRRGVSLRSGHGGEVVLRDGDKPVGAAVSGRTPPGHAHAVLVASSGPVAAYRAAAEPGTLACLCMAEPFSEGAAYAAALVVTELARVFSRGAPWLDPAQGLRAAFGRVAARASLLEGRHRSIVAGTPKARWTRAARRLELCASVAAVAAVEGSVAFARAGRCAAWLVRDEEREPWSEPEALAHPSGRAAPDPPLRLFNAMRVETRPFLPGDAVVLGGRELHALFEAAREPVYALGEPLDACRAFHAAASRDSRSPTSAVVLVQPDDALSCRLTGRLRVWDDATPLHHH
jgi:hypothetical protein